MHQDRNHETMSSTATLGTNTSWVVLNFYEFIDASLSEIPFLVHV